jgi:hypothetical protein
MRPLSAVGARAGRWLTVIEFKRPIFRYVFERFRKIVWHRTVFNFPWPDGGFALNLRPPRGLMWRKTTQVMEIEKKISGDSLELMLSDRIDGPVANNLEVIWIF